MLKFITEGFGTLLLVLAVGISTDPLTAGLILIVLLYIGYSFADAHLNPAVSIGAWTISRDTTGTFLIRIFGQISGAVSGAFLTLWIARIPYVPAPSSSTGVAEFILVELLFSALFVLLFLLMIYPSPLRKRISLFGVIIGIGYGGCLLVIEPLIGFGMHPALNVAFSIVDSINGGTSYMHLPVYLFTPLVAGILSGLLYKKLISQPAQNPVRRAG